MAIDAATFRKPQVLIIAGVFVVAGIYISSQIKKKSDTSKLPPAEVTPTTVSVVGASNVEQMDSTQRALADAQQKLADLLKQQEQDKQDSAAQSDSERAAFNDKIKNLGMSIGDKYSAEIEGLKNQIKQLQSAANTPPTVALPPPTTDQGLPPITPAQPPVAPPATVQPPVAPPATVQPPVAPPATVAPPVSTVGTRDNYTPGYGINYHYDCGSQMQHSDGMRSWEEYVAIEKGKGPGWNNTAQQRNLAQIAVSGTASKGVSIRGSEYGPVTITNTNRIWTNNVRAAWGLRPLLVREFEEMQALMLSLGNADERSQQFQSGAYAKAIFDRFNLPYRCAASVRRF